MLQGPQSAVSVSEKLRSDTVSRCFIHVWLVNVADVVVTLHFL